jgi:hypothetical protein
MPPLAGAPDENDYNKKRRGASFFMTVAQNRSSHHSAVDPPVRISRVGGGSGVRQ